MMLDAATVSARAESIRNGDVRTLSRSISGIENGDPDAALLMRFLYPFTGNARVVGFTGAPGAGKSSVINEAIQAYLERGLRVAVIAVDPTSEFTGGGVLGDRVRMQVFSDRLYIRSFGAGGCLGGLNTACGQTIALLDAAGFDRILVETVGAGQSEIEIRHYADTVVVVSTPNQGDEIQMLKAGILEIGDVFVLNKCELPGAQQAAAELIEMTHLYAMGRQNRIYADDRSCCGAVAPIGGDRKPGGADGDQTATVEPDIPPVVQVSALEKIGFTEMFEAIERKLRTMEERKLLRGRRRRRTEKYLSDYLVRAFQERTLRDFRSGDTWRRVCDMVENAELDPLSAGERLWENMTGGSE
ncbi:MAG: methylmalonyl Co-A mutase-associated GTPase MeaB [Clostridiales Family XIII bacterium]|jgi:LAO/AO transport system kinase|nr:methylmalonyl Co-A mutase-associated GTPase MeaB [Clostridiales Family XIII bacterium]